MGEAKQSSPEEAAYHEAGHTYIAVRDVGVVVDYVRIYPERDGFGGETRIPPDSQDYLYWTTIAVAGSVAEARADAERRFPDENTKLVVNDDVVEQVKRYVDDSEELLKKDIPGAQITFPTEGGKEGVSSISINDARRMTRPYRGRASIKVSLETSVAICNNPGHWKLIKDLVDAVLKADKNYLDRATLERIIKR